VNGGSLGAARSPLLRYTPGLDGVRAFAVLVVIAYHANLAGFTGGYIGVDVFFVLSGFLITLLLIEELFGSDTVHVRRFYMRRVLRLAPALVLALLGTVVLALFVVGPNLRSRTLTTLPFTVLYSTNLMRAAGFNGSGGMLGHTWSLALEEQFYLLWPLVVLGLWRWRRSVASLLVVALVAAMASAGLRAGLYLAGVSTSVLYDFPVTHADGLLLGCAAACGWWLARDRLTKLAGPMVGVAAALLLVVVVVIATLESGWMYVFGLVVVEAATVALVFALLGHSSSALARVFSISALAAIGRRSYGLYLYHYPIFLALGARGFTVKTLIGVVATFAAAWASYALVERRFLAFKSRWAALPGAESRTDPA
jgi:peptidoglycan/LPS O-acetylase OafA/YrhL